MQSITRQENTHSPAVGPVMICKKVITMKFCFPILLLTVAMLSVGCQHLRPNSSPCSDGRCGTCDADSGCDRCDAGGCDASGSCGAGCSTGSCAAGGACGASKASQGGLLGSLAQRKANRPAWQHHRRPQPAAQMGPASPTVAYPYYTTRAPRDFLASDPPSIGP